MHQVNLFEILNLPNLDCRYKLLAVSNLPRDKAYAKNVNLLAKSLAYELQQPVALLYREDGPRFAIPASSKLPKREQILTPHIAILEPLDGVHVLDFRRLNDQTLPIARSFLRSAFQTPLMDNLELWGDRRCYFWKRPLDTSVEHRESEIDIFEGFVFNIVPLGDGRLCISLDITHKYVDRRWFLERVDEQDIDRYRMRHFLYHFGHQWYRAQLLNATGCTVEKQKFYNERTGIIEYVYQYTMDRWCDNPPYWIRTLSKDSPAIIYRYPGSEKQRYGAAALCKLMYSTNEPTVSKLHGMTVLSPQKRFQKIQHVALKLFQNANLDRTPIELSRSPLEVTPRVFPVPDQLFGNDTILKIRSDGATTGIPPSELGRTRLQYLLDKSIGPLSNTPFHAQYIVLPASLPRMISDDVTERFQQMVTQFSSHPYNASPVIYEDRGCNSLHRQVKAIQSALEQAEIRRGYLFLVLPENAKEGLHHYLKRAFWPDLQSQCALASNIREFYVEKHHNGKVTYQVRSGRKRKYISYIRHAALGMLQVNRKWLWALANPLHCDVYIGIDVLNNTAGFTFIYQGGKVCYFRDYQSGQKEKLPARQIRSVISQNLREDVRRLGITPHSLVIHRDGKWYESESLGLKTALDILKREGTLPADVKASVVEIHKNSAFGLRLAEKDRGRLINPELGSWFRINDREGVVCNTGRPFRFPGTANPLHIVIVEGELPIVSALEDTFALSQLLFSAPESCARSPLTVRLADDFLEPIASTVELDEAIYDDLEDELVEAYEVYSDR